MNKKATEYEIPWWNGKRSHFPNHRKEVSTFGENTNTTILLEIARAFFAKQQELSDSAKQIGQVFDRAFHNEEEHIWTKVLMDTKLKARMGVLKTTIMKETFGTQWTKHAELGFESAAELKEAHSMALADWVRDKNKTLLRALWRSAFPEKPPKEDQGSLHKETLRHILTSTKVTELLDGADVLDIQLWWERPYLMPGVVAWVSTLWKYEGVTDDIDGNLLAEIQDITTSGKGKSARPIMEVKRQLEQIMEAPAKRFTSAAELCDFLVSCSLQDIIRTLARGTNREASAWKLADNIMVNSCRTGEMLSSKVIQRAIDIAQAHLERAALEEPEEVNVVTADAEIAALKMEIEKQKKTIETFQASTAGGDKKGGGKGGNGGGNGKKRPRQGEDRPPLKTCSICHRKHPGNPPESQCFQRDLEGEKKELDALIKKKAESGFKPKTEEAKEKQWKARVVFIEDANKQTGAYFDSLSLLPWLPTLDLSMLQTRKMKSTCQLGNVFT